MTTITPTSVTTQVYQVYIKATPQAIWDAITKPEWTERYGYGVLAEYDLRPGGRFTAYSSEEMKKGGLAMGFQTPDVAAEGFTRLTYEISGGKSGVSKLTVVHELEGAPKLALLVSGTMEAGGAGGGWNWVLSGLKTLLETGKPLGG
jgi:uncharacterized protein YndB with AHSA1/START domain